MTDINSPCSSNVQAPPIVATVLLCIAFGMALLTAWVPTMEHISSLGWTEHQRFHAFREIFMATVFSGVAIALCLGPMRRGVPHSFNAVAILGVGVVGGFWLGLPVTGIGKAQVAPYINHGLQLLALSSGLLIARPKA